jgi:hypothetical protein
MHGSLNIPKPYLVSALLSQEESQPLSYRLACAAIGLGILPSKQLITRLTGTGIGAIGVVADGVGPTGTRRRALIDVCRKKEI